MRPAIAAKAGDQGETGAMELRHLRYFVAVADDLSITRAAERLNIAQPALSHQIKSLETEIGTALLQRLSRGVALTEPGRAFADDARAVLAAVDAAKTRARRIATGDVGQIRIGFTSSASFHPLVTGAIRDYRSAYPDVQVELLEETTASLLAAFRAGRVDVAFMRPGEGEADELWARHLFDEPMVVALPATHRLAAEAGAVGLADLSNEGFIVYPRRNGRALYDGIMAACAAAGFSPHIAQNAPQLASVVNLVATGIALAIVPRSMARLATEGVRYRPILGPVPVAPMTLVRHPAPEMPHPRIFTDLVLARVKGGVEGV
ncbi:Hca operon transcriptional activator HcaR [Methylobacterium frigidaeris]|uniref:Hca operon transcriptional activator HcaR n=2 Tax=Methylobacterium frigidaeris TaxID=2038277 RepID=A0AA37HA94_9HYPH|nr:Hca operon transcriptional activator HcaR [Methylobacterium frigidaeris]